MFGSIYDSRASYTKKKTLGMFLYRMRSKRILKWNWHRFNKPRISISCSVLATHSYSKPSALLNLFKYRFETAEALVIH